MDCLLCYRVFLAENEYKSLASPPQPEICTNSIGKLLGIPQHILRGIFEDKDLQIYCARCTQKLEEVHGLLVQLEDLQKRVDKVRDEVKAELTQSWDVSQVVAISYPKRVKTKSCLGRAKILEVMNQIKSEGGIKLEDMSIPSTSGVVAKAENSDSGPSQSQKSKQIAKYSGNSKAIVKSGLLSSNSKQPPSTPSTLADISNSNEFKEPLLISDSENEESEESNVQNSRIESPKLKRRVTPSSTPSPSIITTRSRSCKAGKRDSSGSSASNEIQEKSKTVTPIKKPMKRSAPIDNEPLLTPPPSSQGSSSTQLLPKSTPSKRNLRPRGPKIPLKKAKICIEKLDLPPGVSTFNVKKPLIASILRKSQKNSIKFKAIKSEPLESTQESDDGGDTDFETTESGTFQLKTRNEMPEIKVEPPEDRPKVESEELEDYEDGISETSSTASQKLECQECNEPFEKQDDLTRHLQGALASQILLKCPTCSDEYWGEDCMAWHMKMHQKKLECKFCGDKFTSEELKMTHEETHKGEDKPYKCGKCPKRFGTKSGLGRHAISHSDARSFACSFCSLTFKFPDTCKNHEKSHQKPIECIHCFGGFETQDQLRAHLAEDGEYNCHDCHLVFKSKGCLMKHQWGMHREKMIKKKANEPQPGPSTKP